MVEHQLPKLRVAGSNPVSRLFFLCKLPILHEKRQFIVLRDFFSTIKLKFVFSIVACIIMIVMVISYIFTQNTKKLCGTNIYFNKVDKIIKNTTYSRLSNLSLTFEE